MHVAVIGAGMAGSACARALADSGASVTVLDKGRGVGGRLARRRIAAAAFDHGAQYVVARDEGFRRVMAGWVAGGICAPWPLASAGNGDPVLVGVPSMAAPVTALLGSLPIRTSAEVVALQRQGETWSLRLREGEIVGPFDEVVLAIPAPQAARLLLGAGLDHVATRLDGVAMAPCWTALAAYTQATGRDGAHRFPSDQDLVWAARNDTKPGRGGAEAWTFHAGPEWSARHLEAAPEQVGQALLEAAARQLGAGMDRVELVVAHRWRYALVTRALGAPCWRIAGDRLGLCGDWCLGPRVEAAWLSGTALAAELLR